LQQTGARELPQHVRFSGEGKVYEYVLSSKMRGNEAVVSIELKGKTHEVFPSIRIPLDKPAGAISAAVEQMKDWPQHKGLRCEPNYRPSSQPDLGVMGD
jgi:hypothetical protein